MARLSIVPDNWVFGMEGFGGLVVRVKMESGEYELVPVGYSLADDPAAIERVAFAYFRAEGSVETSKVVPGIPGYSLVADLDAAYQKAWDGFTDFQRAVWAEKAERLLRAAEGDADG